MAQVLFVAALWPVLSGNVAYAPLSRLHHSYLAPTHTDLPLATPRDDELQSDFLDQERIYLRFYRESLRGGELPFWQEEVFGGTSHEDSMIYSYLTPFHLPWLFIDDDHVAKSTEIFLLLNLGLLGVLWWCRILDLAPSWTLLAAVLVLLSPYTFHFHSNSALNTLHFTGLCTTAALFEYLRMARRRDLLFFAVFLCLAIAGNFLSGLLFISIAIALILLTHLARNRKTRTDALIRVRNASVTYTMVLVAMAFFLGPIILESHLVRYAVPVNSSVSAPLFSPMRTLMSLFAYAKSVFSPFWIIIPVSLALAIRARSMPQVPLAILSLLAVWAFAAIVPSSPFLQEIVRAVVPGMKHSGNAFFRLAFFGNMYGILAAVWMVKESTGNRINRQTHVPIMLSLLAIMLVNLGIWFVTLMPDLLRAMPFGFDRLVDHVYDRPERRTTAGLGFLIAFMFLVIWHVKWRSPGYPEICSIMLAFTAGLASIGIYRHQGPNLPRDLDCLHNPLWSSVQSDTQGASLALEECGTSPRYHFRGDFTTAGFRTLDGPVDTGLFTRTREFWAPLNDLQEYFDSGRNWFEVNWVCRELVTTEDDTLSSGFLHLAKSLGVADLFAHHSLNSTELSLVGRVGGVFHYRVENTWPDVVFLPNVSESQFVEAMLGLRDNDPEADAFFAALPATGQGLDIRRLSQLEWAIDAPMALVGLRGVLFMNHSLEYHRGIRFPGVEIPTEGRWQVHSGRQSVDFPLTDVPFRVLEMELPESFSVRYDRSHYALWLPLSAFGIAGLMVLYRKHGAGGRAAAGSRLST